MPWGFVQANFEVNAVSGTTDGVAFTTQNITAGNRIIVGVVGWNFAPSSCADSAGNTYTKHASGADGEPATLAIFSAPITAGGGTKPTVTVTFGSSGSFQSICIAEYSGLSTTSGAGAVDGTAGAENTTSTSPSSGNTANTTAANELVIGVYGDGGAGDTISAGTGFTERTGTTASTLANCVLEDKDSGPSGSAQAATFTLSVANDCYVLCAVFKLAAGGGGSPTPNQPVRTMRQAVNRAATFCKPDRLWVPERRIFVPGRAA